MALEHGLLALRERHDVVPLAGLVRRKISAPFRAGLGGSIRRIAVGCEVAGHGVFWSAALMRERDLEREVGERIRLAVPLVGERAIQP